MQPGFAKKELRILIVKLSERFGHFGMIRPVGNGDRRLYKKSVSE